MLAGKKSTLVSKSLLGVAYLMLVSGVILGLCQIFIIPRMFHKEIEKQMTLVEGTAAYAEWLESSVPSYTKMYLFSVQNPDDILAEEAKPDLKEMGPYTFREVQMKDGIVHNPDNHTITYKIRKFWHFVPEMSAGTLEDIVTTINLPVLSAAAQVKNNFFMAWGLSSTFDATESKVFINRTVGELLFDGYEDPLLSIAEWVGTTSNIPIDKFGWFYKRNGTTWADGVFNMYTGEEDISQTGKIHTWNYGQQTNFEGECGAIKGSAGGFYPPGTGGDHLLLFSHEACRTLSFNFAGNSSIHSVPGNAYKLDGTTFANGTTFPPNKCFGNNLPSGLQNSTRCKTDSPAFLSFPHFHLADPSFAEKLTEQSVKAEPERHESRIILEPNTGIPMEVAIRLQINIQVNPVKGIPLLAELPRDLYLPAFWFDAHVTLSPPVAKKINLLVNLPDIVVNIGIVVICASLIGVMICVVFRIRNIIARRRQKRFQLAALAEDPNVLRPVVKANAPSSILLCNTADHKSRVLEKEDAVHRDQREQCQALLDGRRDGAKNSTTSTDESSWGTSDCPSVSTSKESVNSSSCLRSPPGEVDFRPGGVSPPSTSST